MSQRFTPIARHTRPHGQSTRHALNVLVRHRWPRVSVSGKSRPRNFITAELHKLVFNPLLDPRSEDGAKAFARGKAMQRFAYLNAQLDGRDYLLDGFTVADAYLVVVLNWAAFTGIDLSQWPAVQSYFVRLRERPSVARAFAEEFALYKDEQTRRAA